MVYTVRCSNATDCTLTTYSQDLDSAQLAAAQINSDDYAATTQNQMGNKLKEIFNETAIRINCSITKTTKSVNFAYNIVYGCNETITTALSDGTTGTVGVNAKLNKTRVDDVISCGQFRFL